MPSWGKRPGMLVHHAEPFIAEASRDVLAAGPITPVDGFFARNHGPVPDIDPDKWHLTVDGMVGRPLRISLAELRGRFAEHTVTATLQCAGNRRAGLAEVREIPGEDLWDAGGISTARWTGARLADVLTAAGVLPGAAHVAFTAPDIAPESVPPAGFGGSVPLPKALSSEVLLAWGMNGAPLPVVHGAPVRVIVPGWIGARSVKWLERISVQAVPSDNYFQAVAYRMLPPDADPAQAVPGAGYALGPVDLSSEFVSPDQNSVLAKGPTEVTGYTFAGDGREVARVDVSIDEGLSWTQAELSRPAGKWAWRHWHAAIDLPAGETTLVARARDASGVTQPESPASVWNPKGYANTSWARLRVRCRD